MQKSRQILKPDLECRQRDWCSLEKLNPGSTKYYPERKAQTSRNIPLNKYLNPGEKDFFKMYQKKKKKRSTEFLCVKPTLKYIDSSRSQLKWGGVISKNVPISTHGSNTDLQPTNTNVEMDCATGVYVTRSGGYIKWARQRSGIYHPSHHQTNAAQGLFKVGPVAGQTHTRHYQKCIRAPSAFPLLGAPLVPGNNPPLKEVKASGELPSEARGTLQCRGTPGRTAQN